MINVLPISAGCVGGGDTVRARDESEGCMFDMLSILMQARSFDVDDYTVGQKIIFPMATGTKIEDQTLIYRGKKVFKAEGGVKYRCLVFSLVEYKKGKEKEVITFISPMIKTIYPCVWTFI